MGRRYGQSDTADVVIPGPKVGMTLRLTRDVPPVVCPPVVVCPVLEPLTWHTGNVDETAVVDSSTPTRFLAVVVGSWPPETEFEWALTSTLEDSAAVLTFDPGAAGIAVATLSAGTLEATVTVTAPDCPAQTLGPITLTVTSGGGC